VSADLFAAVETTGAAFLAALDAAAAAAGCTVSDSTRNDVLSAMGYTKHWARFLAEQERPKGPRVAVRLLNWRGEHKPSGRTEMEFVRRTTTTIVLRCEGVGGDQYPTVIQIATGREKDGGKYSYSDVWSIVDLAAALAIDWKAPRATKGARK